MTISSTTVKNSYSGDSSTTTFTYTFKIFADSDIQVIIRSSTGTETTKTITTHYTVTGAGNSGGGSVIFTGGNIPVTGETVLLRRNIPQTQAIDYIANDPFPAESHEEGLDRSTMAIQQLQEEVTRSIKLSRTNTMTSTEFTVAAADRANKVLAFDSTGEISVTQELGIYKGNWATATSYVPRDLVKDTSTNNIFIVDTAHTSSGSQPLTTNANSAFYELIVDAATASTSATAAAASAAAAAASASAASSSASSASSSASTATTQATNASTSASTASTQAGLATTAATNAATSETNAGTSASAASTSASNASSSASSASSSASTATTQAGIATTQAGNASTSATAAAGSASTATTQATNASNSATTATTQASNASTSATAAAASAASAATLLDNFDDVYLGSKIADPALDNDNDPLTAGDLYYNSVGNVLKYYTGVAWVAITSGGITDVVQDTTPQLGGSLDVNGNSIVSVSNGNINITPNGTGSVVLDSISYPQADGSANQVLKTNGSGVLSFTTISGGNITTEGDFFSNYNAITANVTSTVGAGVNAALFAPITVNSGVTWTISGTLSII